VDRAHRIGQKKPVQVFRFITEGTVEEKIIERADRKLFLDAAVIQQGRLAEQNSALQKDEVMKMVRFGADQILNGSGGTYTDEDIDALIARGEEKTSDFESKLQTDAQHNLANFSLLAEDETGKDTFEFGGKNYRGKDKNVGNFINLPQRQRKRNYDVNEYFRETMNTGATSSGMKAHAADAASKKRKKGPALHDFQLFDRERLNAIAEKERNIAGQKEEQIKTISQMRAQAQ
jgi:SWI/SNF-related matrix-associated actin-dependent regulator of chromatin subfamily A member 5